MGHIKFPSIDQFRNVVKAVDQIATFGGFDDDGNVIRIRDAEKPVLTFQGTVKLHGTNASVVLYPDGKIVAQSRNRTLTVESDNAGWAWFVSQRMTEFTNYLHAIRSRIKERGVPITVYGEWCGGNIQKGVALSELEKMFVIFAVRIGDDESSYYLNELPTAPYVADVHNITEFQTWEMSIDFDNPALAQNELIAITDAVEKQCPVGKAFDVDGVGEGVVWRCTDTNPKYNNLKFKVKGEKHSASKVKTLAEVDVSKMNSIVEFVDMAVTSNRVRQGIEYLKEQGQDVTIRQTGDVVRWVVGDVLKEESDTLYESCLEPKDVNASVGKAASKLFHKILDEEVKL